MKEPVELCAGHRLAVLTAALCLLGGVAFAAEVEVSTVPPAGAGPARMERIAGRVVGVKDPGALRIVVFARTDKWYVQPYTAAPYTSIGADGAWSTPTHLGDEYAALLVKPSYRPSDTALQLPEVGGDVLAVKRVLAKQ